MAFSPAIYTIQPFTWGTTEAFIRKLRAVVGAWTVGQNATPEALLQSLNASIDPHTEHGRWHAGIKHTLIADATAWLAAREAARVAAAAGPGAPPPAAPVAAPVLTMSDLCDYYIELLLKRFEPQRLPTLERELRDAKQEHDELPSSYYYRLEHLLSQVPHVWTKDQLYITFVNGLHTPTVKGYVETILNPLPRHQWGNQFPAITTGADQVTFNSTTSVDPQTSSGAPPYGAPSAAPASQPAPVSALSTSGPAPAAGDPASADDDEPDGDFHCMVHGWCSHDTDDCPYIRELVQEYRNTRGNRYHKYDVPPYESNAAPQALSTHAPPYGYHTYSYAPPPTASYGHQPYVPPSHQYGPPYAHGPASPAPSSYSPPSAYSTHSFHAPSSTAPYSDSPDAFRRRQYCGPRCETCGGKHAVARCYIEHPELAPPGWEPRAPLARTVWAMNKLKLL